MQYFRYRHFYADLYSLAWWKGHIRIAFGEESVSEKEYWRTAVVLEPRNVKRLIKSLQRTLEIIEPVPPPVEPGKDKPGG